MGTRDKQLSPVGYYFIFHFALLSKFSKVIKCHRNVAFNTHNPNVLIKHHRNIVINAHNLFVCSSI